MQERGINHNGIKQIREFVEGMVQTGGFVCDKNRSVRVNVDCFFQLKTFDSARIMELCDRIYHCRKQIVLLGNMQKGE